MITFRRKALNAGPIEASPAPSLAQPTGRSRMIKAPDSNGRAL
jgi:hypothetical protein